MTTSMKNQALVRESTQADLAAIESLYPQAFPDEDLVPLVRDLLPDLSNVLSIVATVGPDIVGHGVFTRCGIIGTDIRAELLGPLGVAPAWQGQGIGSEIVRHGLQQLENADVDIVCVLGDPNYYGRFGFVPESSVEPPYELPAEWLGAWQSLRMGDRATPVSGKLAVPPQWRQRSLWAP